MKKILIAALAALLALVSVCAAGEEDESSGSGWAEFRNPLYPNARLKPHMAVERPDGMDLFRSGPEYTDEREAGIAMRGMLMNKQERITICIASTDKRPAKVIRRIADTALEHTGDPRGGDYINWTYGGYISTWMWETDREGVRHYVFDATVTYYTTLEQEREMDRAVAALMPTLDLEGKTEYKKVRAIYDYITSHVTYDYDRLEDPDYYLKYTAYAALVNGTSVCQGYATLFYRLALEAGVDARLIYGDGGGGLHSWNIAGILGEYYLLDATWDAGMAEYGYDYFLRGSQHFPMHEAYSDFLPQYALSKEDYEDTVAEGPCGEGAGWILDRAGVLTVYGQGGMDSFHAGAPWSGWKDRILSVVIESGVTSVGDFAFSGCGSLASAVLANSVEAIGEGAFAGCAALSEVVYTGTAAKWERIAVGPGNEALESARLRFSRIPAADVTLPASLTAVPDEAFAGLPEGTAVYIPEGVRAIADGAFGEGTVIVAPAGSFAAQWAEENGFTVYTK